MRSLWFACNEMTTEGDTSRHQDKNSISTSKKSRIPDNLTLLECCPAITASVTPHMSTP